MKRSYFGVNALQVSSVVIEDRRKIHEGILLHMLGDPGTDRHVEFSHFLH